MQLQLELRPLLGGHLILRRVEPDHPDIYLHQEKSGRAKWTFENNAPTKQRASRPANLPTMRDLAVDSDSLVLIDELRRLKIKGTVAAADQNFAQLLAQAQQQPPSAPPSRQAAAETVQTNR